MICIYDWFGYKLPVKERYRLIREAGFDGVMLWWSNCFGRADGDISYRMGADIARSAGLAIENIHAPVDAQNDLSCDNADGEALFINYMQCIQDCNDNRIGTMVVHLTEDRFPVNSIGMGRIARLTYSAEEQGVNIAMENLFNIENLTKVLENIQSPHIGLCFDSCHYVNNPSADGILQKYGSRLMALHLHDNGGERNQHRLPFDGNADWDMLMRSVADTGYAGATSLEPMNWDYTDITIEEFLHKAYIKASRLDDMRKMKEDIWKS